MSDERIIYDLFPARVLVTTTASLDTESLEVLSALPRVAGSRTVDRVRVILTQERVLIGADSSDGPTLIFRDRIRPGTLRLAKSRNTEASVLVTETDKVLVFIKDQNCGCGTRLRSWNPYRTLQSTADPTE